MTGVLRQKQKMMKFTSLLQDDLRKKPGEKCVSSLLSNHIRQEEAVSGGQFRGGIFSVILIHDIKAGTHSA